MGSRVDRLRVFFPELSFPSTCVVLRHKRRADRTRLAHCSVYCARFIREITMDAKFRGRDERVLLRYHTIRFE